MTYQKITSLTFPVNPENTSVYQRELGSALSHLVLKGVLGNVLALTWSLKKINLLKSFP